MVLNRQGFKSAGGTVSAADWNELVAENWAVVGNWHLGGTALSNYAAGTPLGAMAYLTGVELRIDFSELSLAIPQRAEIQHLAFEIMGLRSNVAATSAWGGLAFNDDAEATNYYESWSYGTGATQTFGQDSGGSAWLHNLISGDSSPAGAVGAISGVIWNYQSAGPKYFWMESICPNAGAPSYITKTDGAYYGAAIESMQLTDESGTGFLVESAGITAAIVNVYGLYAKDDL